MSLLRQRRVLELVLAFGADPAHRLVVVAARISPACEPRPRPRRRAAAAARCAPVEREEHDHDRPADELGRGELPTHQHDEHDAELDARGSSRRT